MRIIIIIVTTTSSGALGILVFASIFFLVFSSDGDATSGSINFVNKRAQCYPSLGSLEAARAIGEQLDNQKVPYSDKRVNETLASLGIVWLEEGTDVKVMDEQDKVILNYLYNRGYKIPNHGIMCRVEPIDSVINSCHINCNRLEMGFFQWIKWTLGKEFKKFEKS